MKVSILTAGGASVSFALSEITVESAGDLESGCRIIQYGLLRG